MDSFLLANWFQCLLQWLRGIYVDLSYPALHSEQDFGANLDFILALEMARRRIFDSLAYGVQEVIVTFLLEHFGVVVVAAHVEYTYLAPLSI